MLTIRWNALSGKYAVLGVKREMPG